MINASYDWCLLAYLVQASVRPPVSAADDWRPLTVSCRLPILIGQSPPARSRGRHTISDEAYGLKKTCAGLATIREVLKPHVTPVITYHLGKIVVWPLC